MNLPKIKYDARDFTQIVENLREMIEVSRPDLQSDFFDTGLGQMLIDLIAYYGATDSFALNRVQEESILATSRQYSSALAHAASTGYKIQGKTAASVTMEVEADNLPSSFLTYGMTIPAGTVISTDGINFELLETVTFSAGNLVRFTMSEGTTITGETHSGPVSATPYFSVTTIDTGVIQSSWTVRINGEEWTEVQDVNLVVGSEQVYQTVYAANESVSFQFGNGTEGALVPNNAIISIDYRIGSGSQGNVPALSLTARVDAEIRGRPVSVLAVNKSKASGGQDRETLSHIKRFIPLHLRTVGKAVTAEDYTTLAASFVSPEFGAIKRAIAKLRDGTVLVSDSSSSENVEVPANTQVVIAGRPFHTLSTISLNKKNLSIFVDPNTVDLYIWTMADSVFTTPSDGIKLALLLSLNTKSMLTVTPHIVDGLVEVIDIVLGDIAITSVANVDLIEAEIERLTEEYFNREEVLPGSAFRVSDYVNLIENISGVDHFEITSPTADVEVSDITMIQKGTISYSLVRPAAKPPSHFLGKY